MLGGASAGTKESQGAMDYRSSYVDIGPHPRGDLSGAIVAGRYRITRPLGHGSAGTVYLAFDLRRETQVALKVLHPELAAHPGMLARFEREAQAAARLTHPSAIHVTDFGQDPASDLLYLAMDYVAARDLRTVLAEDWPLSDARIVGIMSQVLSALSAAHALGIVHRDLKPENILVGGPDDDADAEQDEQVWVCDFGIAQLSPTRLAAAGETGTARLSQLTGPGMVVGTPSYMSPEQARAENQDARSDIYSAGVVLFQLMTRTLPFVAKTPLSVAVMHCSTPPPPPSGYCPVNAALEAACLRALSKTREARFQSAREMQQAVEAALTHDAVADKLARRISALPGATRNLPPRAPHPSLAPSERVIAHDTVPKYHHAPFVIGGLLLCIVALGWLPRYLGNDANDPTDGEELVKPRLVAQPARKSAAPVAASAQPLIAPAGQPPQALAAAPAGQLPHPAALPAAPTEPPVAANTLRAPTPPLPAASALNVPNAQAATRHEAHHQSRAPQAREPERTDSMRGASLQAAYAASADAPIPSASEPIGPSDPTLSPGEQSVTNPIGASADVPAEPARPAAAQTPNDQPSTPTIAEPVGPVAPVEPLAAVPPAAVPPAAVPPAAVPPAAVPPAAVPPAAVPPAATVTTPTPVPVSQPIAAAVPAQDPDAASLAARARVIASEPFTRAAVSRASILAAVNQSALTRCYQDGLRSGTGPTHTVTARLDFSANMGGRIVYAGVHGAELPKKLRDCIERMTRQGRVREVDTGEAQASVTLTFQPR
jgi:serine/threonine protein kinase